MRHLLFLFAILFTATITAQPKAEGIYDSLNGKVRSMTVYIFTVTKNAKGNFEAKPDYFTHHQDFIYDDNNKLLFRNFYEDKKKIRESRDMVAFNKQDPSVRYDTAYSTTDTSREMLVTKYRNDKLNESFCYITMLKNTALRYYIYKNAEGRVTIYDRFVMAADGLEKSRWQYFPDKPINLSAEPYTWEKFNEKGHLMLTVYNMIGGVKKSTSRKYEYDDHNNAVFIQFLEWNTAIEKYEPVKEAKISYKYSD